MKTAWFLRLGLGVILVGLCACNFGCRRTGEASPPELRFAQSDHNLSARLASEITDGQAEIEAPFTLTNASTEVKEVVFQGTSCGCTGCFLAGRALKPGDRLTVESQGTVQVILQSHVGAAPGVLTYRASFGVGDGTAGREPLTVQSHLRVWRDVALDPGVLSCDFTAAEARGVEKTMRVARTFRAEKPASVAPALSGLPPQVEILGVAEEGPTTRLEGDLWQQSWSVKFAVRPPGGGAKASALGRATVSFGEGTAAVSAELPVILHRVYGIEAPELSHFGDVPAGERRTRRLVIRSAEGRDFRVSEVRTDGDAFSVAGDGGQAKSSHILEAAFRATRPGPYRGRMVVRTDHPECPELSIELAAAVPDDVKTPAPAKP